MTNKELIELLQEDIDNYGERDICDEMGYHISLESNKDFCMIS